MGGDQPRQLVLIVLCSPVHGRTTIDNKPVKILVSCFRVHITVSPSSGDRGNSLGDSSSIYIFQFYPQLPLMLNS